MHFDVHRFTLDGRCQHYHNHSLGHLKRHMSWNQLQQISMKDFTRVSWINIALPYLSSGTLRRSPSIPFVSLHYQL